MKKLKRFILSSSSNTLCNEEMIEIVGGTEADTYCDFKSSRETCSGSCSYAGYTGYCVHGSIGPLTGCYCYIS